MAEDLTSTAPAGSAKPFELGVLLVHGIGTQPSGETLTRWGDVLIDTIRRATRNKVDATIERADHVSGEDSERAEMIVRLDGESSSRWLLSEGWWADSFPPPSYGELVSWSLRALPWFVALYIARRYWQTSSRNRVARLVALSSAFGQLLVALALAPLFITLLALMLLLGLLPIPQLRATILSLQSSLTATVGDSMAFVESPVRAACIRTRILDGIKRHKTLCSRTVVVAHSQGAAAVLDALGALAEPDYGKQQLRAHHMVSAALTPDTLITFGAGTNPLVSQKALAAGLLTKLGMNPATYTIGALFAVAAIAGLLYLDLRSGQTSLKQILEAAGLLVLASVAAGGLLWTTKRVIDALAAKSPAVASRRLALIAGIVGGILLVATVVGVATGKFENTPVNLVILLFMALLILPGSMSMILSRELKTLLAAGVTRSPALDNWIDLYASADPVPNGPTDTAEGEYPGSERIWNRGSFLTDHTTYWENLDGFVLRVVRACVRTAGDSWEAHLPPQIPAIDSRAAWRVRYLRLAFWINALIWTYFGVRLWSLYGDNLPVQEAIPGWLPLPIARLAVIAAAVAFVGWIAYGLMSWLWNRWARREQEAVLSQNEPGAEQAGYLLLMGFVLWLLVIAAYDFHIHGWASACEVTVNPKGFLLVPLMAVGCAWISNFLLRALMRPPVIYAAGESATSRQGS